MADATTPSATGAYGMSSMLPDEAIRRLEEDLYLARKTIIGLAPDQFHDLLRGFAYTIETQNDLYRWQSDLNAAVIAAAEPIEPVGRWDDPKVACPLCRSRGRGAFGMTGGALPAVLRCTSTAAAQPADARSSTPHGS